MNNRTVARQRVLDCARSWLGTPYMHQASLKGVGCDCLGLLRGIWREIEGAEPERVPAYSSSWAETGGRERLLEVAQSYFDPTDMETADLGDVLIFRMRPHSVAKHCGIVSSPTHFIHAYDGNAVVENALGDFWSSRIVAAFRFPSVSRDVATV
ncbi:MAG: NlpC/P60 family protein [Ahrensia sp.]|nr:NlpC/P60 family protein [Ahrensia sp.]